MTSPRRVPALILAVLACSSPVWAAAKAGKKKARRQLSAHVHGEAELNIALEGKVLKAALKMPLDSLVGFEHAPRTPQEKEAMAKATTDLGQDGTVLALPAAAQCRLTAPEVKTSFEEDDRDDEPKAGKKAEGQGGKDDHHAEEHANAQGDFTWECAAPEALKSFDVGLFQRFPRVAKVTVNLIAGTKQTMVSLGKDKTTVTMP